MTWVKLDDRMPDNAKIAPLSDAAFRAYVTSICYCARELTDGVISMRKAKEYAGRPRVVQELVPSLWEPLTGENLRVHDYLKYNPTRADTMKAKDDLSRKRSEAGKRGMANRWQTDNTSDNKSDNKPHNPVAPIPEGDLDQSPSYPDPETPEPQPRTLRLPARAVVVGFEQCFARLLSGTELELIKALEEEHPQERIEYALREAAALNKRSVRYVQRTCERMATNDGDSDGTDGRFQATGSGSGRMAVGVSDMDRRRAALAERRRAGIT